MKTLADVLRSADPVGAETRGPDARARTRSSVLNGPPPQFHEIRTLMQRRTLAMAAALACTLVAAGVFVSRYASVDTVAAMRFEARIEGSADIIIDTHDILTAEVVSLHDKGANGRTKSTFGVALTLTAEGGEKLRRATEAHIGEHLELAIDDKVVMAPTIRGAISTSAMLTGDYTRAEAERIAQGLLKGKLEK